MSNILIEKGQRAVIVGQTGSGKTVGAIWQLQHIDQAPVIILDTKGEPAFNRIAREGESLLIFENTDKFLDQWRKKEQPEYIIVRPEPEEIANPLMLDQVLLAIYTIGKACLIYIDEAYQWHVNGRAGAGLIGLLTRGRSKNMSMLISTQRPAWVSRFVFTESQKIYVYRLADKRDMKTLAEFIPDFGNNEIPKKFEFWYYDVAGEGGAILYDPVPLPKQAKVSNIKRAENWI